MLPYLVKKIAEYICVKHAVVDPSGTVALYLALLADEVN